MYFNQFLITYKPLFMLYLFAIQLALFCFFFSYVTKLFINLLIDKQ